MGKPIVLYSKKGCHLCEEAYELVTSMIDSSYKVEVRDISLSDEDTERYGLMIPVLKVDDEIVAYGKIHKKDILGRFIRVNS